MKEILLSPIVLLLVLIIAILTIMSCGTKTDVNCEPIEYHSEDLKNSIHYGQDNDGTYHIIVIDSCEYICGYVGGGPFLTHKGNCKNKIHKLLN